MLVGTTGGQASVVRVQALAWRWLTQLELEALVRVQVVWRWWLQRDHVVKFEMAALRVQAWFRCALGWWEATDRSLDDLLAWLEERCEVVDMLEEAGCELAGWPLDLVEQDPLVVAGGLTMAVNGIVRIQASKRGWIGQRAFYDMIAAFMEDLLRRVVMRIQAGVCGWIVRRHVAQYQRLQALEEKEVWGEARSRLRTAAFVAARATRQAQVDKDTAWRVASAANARVVADLASASLAVDHVVVVLGEQVAGAAAVRFQACWRLQLGHQRYILWEGELYDPDDGPVDTRWRKWSDRACTGCEAVALRDVEVVVAKWGNTQRSRHKGGKGGQKARVVATVATAATCAPARVDHGELRGGDPHQRGGDGGDGAPGGPRGDGAGGPDPDVGTHHLALGWRHQAGASWLDQPRGARPLRVPLASCPDVTGFWRRLGRRGGAWGDVRWGWRR
jgi:hypothetical protein